MNVVKAVEALGSSSGRTKKTVKIGESFVTCVFVCV